MIDWVKQIKNVPLKSVYSQFGEESIFDYIFSKIGTNKFLVDLGAGGLGSKMSNTQYLIENGWNGLRVDGEQDPNRDIKQEFITAENIVEIFEKYKTTKNIDLLSIDLDGNDFWILKSLLDGGYSPRVIINEFNGCLSEGVIQIMKNNPSHTWGENDYYGASFEAFKFLLEDYTLVHQVATTNMIFIRKDIVAKEDYGITYVRNQYHGHSPNREWIIIKKEDIELANSIYKTYIVKQ